MHGDAGIGADADDLRARGGDLLDHAVQAGVRADHVDVPYELLAQGKMDAILVSPQDEGQYEWVQGAMRSPSSVRRTPLRPRSSSVKPTSFSSEFIMCVRPDLLAQGKMDAILVSPQDEGQYEWVHLADDPMFAVLPKDFDTQGMTAFPLAAFEARDFIMPSQGFDKDIMRIFNRIGVKPHILPTWVDDPTVISMVSHGLGVSMMTELTVRGRTDGVKLLPVEPASSRELGLAVRSLDAASDGLRHFSTARSSSSRKCSPEPLQKPLVITAEAVIIRKPADPRAQRKQRERKGTPYAHLYSCHAAGHCPPAPLL